MYLVDAGLSICSSATPKPLHLADKSRRLCVTVFRMMEWLNECVSATPEKSTTHSIFGFCGDDFGGSRFDVKIPRLYINQRLARNTEKAILYISGFCVGVRYEEN